MARGIVPIWLGTPGACFNNKTRVLQPGGPVTIHCTPSDGIQHGERMGVGAGKCHTASVDLAGRLSILTAHRLKTPCIKILTVSICARARPKGFAEWLPPHLDRILRRHLLHVYFHRCQTEDDDDAKGSKDQASIEDGEHHSVEGYIA